MESLTINFLEELIKPGPRLPLISEWFLKQVWTKENFIKSSSTEYLTDGEKKTHSLEELIAASAPQFYDELASASLETPRLTDRLAADTAVVIFDGASLREIPLFLQKAEESGYRILESSFSFAALPSTTTAFVARHLIGKEVTPKSLPQRKELRDLRFRVYYFDDVLTSHQVLSEEEERLLLWSAFPDFTYQDSGARFISHFAAIQKMLDSAWKNTVMQIPRDRRIIITSDHGYIFFGAGFESTRSNEDCKWLDQGRFKIFSETENIPASLEHIDLQVFPDKRLAMVRGRLKDRPRGPAANRVYRHGGLSLMEMLVPWLVLEKKGPLGERLVKEIESET